jgi:ParB family chromosome partitioning protein
MTETMKKDETSVTEPILTRIPLDKIEIVENVRKHFDAAKMKELTESIKQRGVQVPIIVVSGDKAGTYKLVAGERRVRAARSLDLKEIPASVVEADAAAQADIQLLENLQREDLGPVEEAQGFKRLLDDGKYTLEGLAKRVDKSVKYVTRSVRLLELPKAAIKAIEKGTISPEHGHQILRAPEDKRETFVEYALAPKWGGVVPTIHDLTSEIERRLEKDLSKACFPKDREYAGAIACAACPFNTGNQDVLFEGAKDGKCTNGSCFTKKSNLFLREFRDDAAKKFKDLKFAGYAGQDHGAPREVGAAAVLSVQEIKSEAVKALLKKDPKKFGFAVIKPSRFGTKTPTATLVCHDLEFVAKKLRKASESKAERVMTQEEREQERFVQTSENGALFAAAAKSLKAVKKVHLVDLVLALNGTEEAYRAVGVEAGEDAARALAKLSEKDLLRLAWLCTVQHYELDERFGDLGVEVKKVRKEARVLAQAEWVRLKNEQEIEAQEKVTEIPKKEVEAATR